MVIGPGSVNLRRRLGWRCAAPGSPRMRGAAAPQLAGDHRHQRLVAVVADPDADPAVEIDAFDPFEKAVDEMLARLLAVADDVDPGIFLELERDEGGVALALDQRLALEAPGRPQHARLGQPGRLRERAGDCRF